MKSFYYTTNISEAPFIKYYDDAKLTEMEALQQLRNEMAERGYVFVGGDSSIHLYRFNLRKHWRS